MNRLVKFLENLFVKEDDWILALIIIAFVFEVFSILYSIFYLWEPVFVIINIKE